MEKRENTVKDLMTITYMIFFIAAAITAITGGESANTYFCLGLTFMGASECLDTKSGKKVRAKRK